MQPTDNKSTTNVSNRIEQKFHDQLEQNSVVVFGLQNSIPLLDLSSKLIFVTKRQILVVGIDENGGEDEAGYKELFKRLYGITQLPVVFVNKKYIGGVHLVLPMLKGKLGTFEKLLHGNFMYDLCIIGGGTCGSKAAIDASKNMLVALVDSNVDTLQENKSGLGEASKLTTELLPKYFIHKKLFHFKKREKVNIFTVWQDIMNPLQEIVSDELAKRLKSVLGEKNIRYYPGRAVLLDSHTVRVTNSDKVSKIITARKIIIATGTKLSVDNIEGANLGITTEDLFQMTDRPQGKILIVGDALKSLEIGGMLGKMGLFCILMTKGTCTVFDEDFMSQVIQMCKVLGLKFLLDYKVTKLVKEGGHIIVHGVNNLGEEFEEPYNIVLFSNNRRGRTNHLGLDKVGLKVNKNNDKIVCNLDGTTENPSIFVTGSVMDGPFSCTDNTMYTQHTSLLIRGFEGQPVAPLKLDTAFPRIALTPREYGAIGDTEQTAIRKYGRKFVRIYLASRFQLFVKVVCLKYMNDRIIGIHILNPRVADILQTLVTVFNLGFHMKDITLLKFTEKDIKKKKDVKIVSERNMEMTTA